MRISVEIQKGGRSVVMVEIPAAYGHLFLYRRIRYCSAPGNCDHSSTAFHLHTTQYLQGSREQPITPASDGISRCAAVTTDA